MPRKLTGRACKAKGSYAETEIVNILNEKGIPSQKVIASGSFADAGADLKIGVELEPDGSMPERDSSKCLLKVEVKNRKDNPERLWTYLNQSKVSRAVILRRARVPSGILKEKNYNEAYMVCMGLDDWSKLIEFAVKNGFRF